MRQLTQSMKQSPTTWSKCSNMTCSTFSKALSTIPSWSSSAAAVNIMNTLFQPDLMLPTFDLINCTMQSTISPRILSLRLFLMSTTNGFKMSFWNVNLFSSARSKYFMPSCLRESMAYIATFSSLWLPAVMKWCDKTVHMRAHTYKREFSDQIVRMIFWTSCKLQQCKIGPFSCSDKHRKWCSAQMAFFFFIKGPRYTPSIF